ncbi:hypothetical protein [Pendulispora albinea]|uniref:Uncharacterized protein n=1 Tax=Pendulispora albinea TaxID=2741071 RepID=A0ABZ2M1Y8_9BACT
MGHRASESEQTGFAKSAGAALEAAQDADALVEQWKERFEPDETEPTSDADVSAAFLLHRAKGHTNIDNAHLISELARELVMGEHDAAFHHGELDDLFEHIETMRGGAHVDAAALKRGERR